MLTDTPGGGQNWTPMVGHFSMLFDTYSYPLSAFFSALSALFLSSCRFASVSVRAVWHNNVWLQRKAICAKQRARLQFLGCPFPARRKVTRKITGIFQFQFGESQISRAMMQLRKWHLIFESVQCRIGNMLTRSSSLDCRNASSTRYLSKLA